MAFTKKVTKTTKSPAVMVETKKISTKDTCGISFCDKTKHLALIVLVVLNTFMMVWILFNQSKIEADKVGWRSNYNMVQKIYKSDAFKQQQTQQIEQALQMYQWGGTQVAPTASDTTAMPTVDAVSAQ